MANKCLRCGGCCMTADLNIGKVTKENEKEMKETLRYFGYHRCDIMTRKHSDGSRSAIVRIPMYCTHLEYSLEEKCWFCKIYKNRPNICRDFGCLKDTLIKEKEKENGKT